jgi:hypothetical protein
MTHDRDNVYDLESVRDKQVDECVRGFGSPRTQVFVSSKEVVGELIKKADEENVSVEALIARVLETQLALRRTIVPGQALSFRVRGEDSTPPARIGQLIMDGDDPAIKELSLALEKQAEKGCTSIVGIAWNLLEVEVGLAQQADTLAQVVELPHFQLPSA